MGWGGGREDQEGRNMCILITDSHYCAAGTNTTTVESNYPPFEKKKKMGLLTSMMPLKH